MIAEWIARDFSAVVFGLSPGRFRELSGFEKDNQNVLRSVPDSELLTADALNFSRYFLSNDECNKAVTGHAYKMAI